MAVSRAKKRVGNNHRDIAAAISMTTLLANATLLLLLAWIPGPSLAFSARIAPSSSIHRSSSGLTATTREVSRAAIGSSDSILEEVNGILTTSSSLRASPSLTPTRILDRIRNDHSGDVRLARQSSIPFEDETCSRDDRHPIDYEPLGGATTNTAIAIRTKKSTPLLNEGEIELLRRAAESYWSRPVTDGDEGGEKKSRFTYQKAGNSEAHLSDVARYAASLESKHANETSDIISLVNELFLARVYPWIRKAYLSREEGGDELALYVYDSLFIRYNATQANAANNPRGDEDGTVVNANQRKNGAGQPLHRDLGYVSVNVMLNSRDEFDGGGTFFENQLRPALARGDDGPDDDDAVAVAPLTPVGPGHAIAHFSSDRHSGAATCAGVRDILVVFLSATEKSALTNVDARPTPPRWECGARLKGTSRTYCAECSDDARDRLACRMLHQRLAIDQAPEDGEAWHYLGMALHDYYLRDLQQPSATTNREGGESFDEKRALELAVSCLEEAAKRTPCDGRLYNNLGIALERSLERCRIDSAPKKNEIALNDKIGAAYRKSIAIHSACERVGCDAAADFESACLNYGLYLSKRDEFGAAVAVLSRISHSAETAAHSAEMDAAAWARERVLRDAARLMSFCQMQLK